MILTHHLLDIWAGTPLWSRLSSEPLKWGEMLCKLSTKERWWENFRRVSFGKAHGAIEPSLVYPVLGLRDQMWSLQFCWPGILGFLCPYKSVVLAHGQIMFSRLYKVKCWRLTYLKEDREIKLIMTLRNLQIPEPNLQPKEADPLPG